MSYEIRLNRRAIKQSRKLDPHIKEIVKRRLREGLALDPSKYPLLSGRYSRLRRIAFSTPGGEFRTVYSVREDKKRVIVVFVGNRENFYKELQKYLR